MLRLPGVIWHVTLMDRLIWFQEPMWLSNVQILSIFVLSELQRSICNRSLFVVRTFYFYSSRYLCYRKFSIACPANCAGHGICDFNQAKPICNCFDGTDSTAGCYNSFIHIPPEIGWNARFAPSSSHRRMTSIHLGLLFHLLSAAMRLIWANNIFIWLRF